MSNRNILNKDIFTSALIAVHILKTELSNKKLIVNVLFRMAGILNQGCSAPL